MFQTVYLLKDGAVASASRLHAIVEIGLKFALLTFHKIVFNP